MESPAAAAHRHQNAWQIRAEEREKERRELSERMSKEQKEPPAHTHYPRHRFAPFLSMALVAAAMGDIGRK